MPGLWSLMNNAKPLFVLIMFVMLIALFAGGAIGSTDLTPGTPPDPRGSQPGVLPGYQYTGGGPCGPNYTVRQGDTLSQIARTCGVTLNILLASNPSITNPNLIRPGQVLSIYYVATAAPTLPPPPTVVSPAQNTIPDTGMSPGEIVVVSVTNFPPLTNVAVQMGKENGTLELVKEPRTDASGGVRVEVPIPVNALPGEKWVVVITSRADPNLVVRSPAYTIAP